MKLMTVINRLLGLRAFDDSKGQPRLLFSLPYLVFLWSLVSVAAVLHTQFLSSFQNVEDFASLFALYPYVGNGFSLTFLGFYHSKTFFMYNKKMLQVDNGLYKLGISPKYRASFVSSIILIIACFSQMVTSCSNTIIWFISQVGVPIGIYIGCLYLYVSYIGAFILFDFITCMRSVGRRFEKVNNLLEIFATDGFQNQKNKHFARVWPRVIQLRSNNWMLLSKNFGTHQHPSRTEEQRESVEKRNWRLQMIKLVHLDLCQASTLLLKAFVTQVTLQIRWGVVATTLMLYYIYNVTQPPLNVQWLMLNAWSIVHCIVEFVKLFLLSQACEHACREAEKALSIVHACPFLNDSVMKDEIRQFALQLSHCQQGCTKRYFSVLNYSLLSECVGRITTYLVIMIQMHHSFQSQNSPVIVNNTMLDQHTDS